MIESIIREGKRKLLSLMHNIEYIVSSKRVEPFIRNNDPTVITNTAPKRCKSICFIITRLVRFHGGQTSILRLGTKLAELGYDITYIIYKPQSVEEMRLCAASNLARYSGRVMSLSSYRKRIRKNAERAADVVVATSWDTVSYAKQLPGYKMYFVQDYEPYFYSFGEMFLMAKNTYVQGLHMVSLGAWNKEMIVKSCEPVSPIDVISFPYEKAEYRHVGRDYEAYKSKKVITIAVYLKYYGKRLPNLIPHMLINTARKLKEKGLELNIQYFGEARQFRPKGGRNLGMLNKEELAELYRRADFGMVASMSNISLVPYEMLATGLPVIEFKEGTFPYFFQDDSALLISMSNTDFADALYECIKHPDILRERAENAASYMKELSWERTAGEFARILESVEV